MTKIDYHKKLGQEFIILVLSSAIVIITALVALKYYVSYITYQSSFPSSLIATYPQGTYLVDPLNIPFAGATMVTSGNTVKGYLRSATDTNYYIFKVSARSTVSISLTNLPKDYDLVVYTPDRGFVVRSKKEGLKDELVDLILNPGQYYLRVYSKSGDTSPNPYSLMILVNPIQGKQ